MIIYQADVRSRLELVEKYGIDVDVEHQNNMKSDTGLKPLTPREKWPLARRRGLNDKDLRRDELGDLATAVELKLTRTGHGATVALDSAGRHPSAGATPAIYNDSDERPLKKHRTEHAPQFMPPVVQQWGQQQHNWRKGSPHMIRNGVFVTNKSGHYICPGFSAGTCMGYGRCPNDQGAHQCNVCLMSGHMPHETGKCPKNGQWAEQPQKKKGGQKAATGAKSGTAATGEKEARRGEVRNDLGNMRRPRL